MTLNNSALISRVAHIDSSCGYVEHYVSKLDTLAGLAIKYGVEVADVKRFNGLATDSQMYAHKILKIPLYGKHPTTFDPSSSDFSFIRKIDAVEKHQIRSRNKTSSSAAMELLRGYYGLSSSGKNEGLAACEGHSELESSSPPGKLPLDGNCSKYILSNAIYSKREAKADGTSPASEDMSEHVMSTNVMPIFGDVDNERSCRRRFKSEIINLPSSTAASSGQDADKISDKSDLNSVSMNGHEIPMGLPLTMLRVLDEALAGITNKEFAVNKERKSSNVSSLQDQASLQVNLAVQKFICKVEEKLPSSLNLSQAGLRGFLDLLPKAAYRFKTALD